MDQSVTATGQSNKPLVTPAKSKMLVIVLFLLTMLCFLDRQLIPAILEPMKKDLGFTDGQMGMLQSAFLMSVALLAAPISLVVDRWSRRKSVGCMSITWSCMTALAATVSIFPLLFGARALAGASQSAFKPASVAWLSTILPSESRSRYVGYMGMAIPLGSALGMAGAGTIAHITGNWRIPLYIFPVMGILLGLMAFGLPDYKTQSSGGSGKVGDTVRSIFKDWGCLLRNKTFLLASFASGAYTFGGFALLGWTPTLYMRGYDLTGAQAGQLTGVFLVVAAAGAFVGGHLSDWWQKRCPNGRARASFLAGVTMFGTRILYLSCLFNQWPLPLAITLGIIDRVAAYFWVPTNDVLLLDPVSPKLRATAFGFAYLIIYMLGASWGPSVVGYLSDYFGGGYYGIIKGCLFTMPIIALNPLCQFLILKTYLPDTAQVREEVEAE